MSCPFHFSMFIAEKFQCSIMYMVDFFHIIQYPFWEGQTSKIFCCLSFFIHKIIDLQTNKLTICKLLANKKTNGSSRWSLRYRRYSHKESSISSRSIISHYSRIAHMNFRNPLFMRFSKMLVVGVEPILRIFEGV